MTFIVTSTFISGNKCKKNSFTYLPQYFLVLITSGLSGSFGYKYAKKESELEKEAAIKGVEYDLREKLSKEALEKAEEVVESELNSNQGESQKTIKSFYENINKGEFEKAWELLSDNAQKDFKGLSSFKYSFKNIESLEVKEIEFRTQSALSEMDAVKLDIKYITQTSTQKDGEKTVFVNTISSGENWLIDKIEEEE